MLVLVTVLVLLAIGVGYLVKVVAAQATRSSGRLIARPGDRPRRRWDLAERVAVRVAGREPFAESYHYASLAARLRRAHRRGRGAGGGRDRPALAGRSRPARGSPTGAGWVRANVASFQRLLRPLTDALGDRLQLGARSARRPARSPAPRWARCSAGCRPGCSASTTCSSSRTRTPTTRTSSTTWVRTSSRLEKRFAFPPREFRLWLALHEVTHRAQFTGVPWMRAHFLSLVDESLGAVDPDPQAVPRRHAPGGRGDARRTQPARRRRPGRRCWPAPSSTPSSNGCRA